MPVATTRATALPALLVLVLAACATRPPIGLEDALLQAPTAKAVQADPGRFLGQSVRWGGEILAVRNDARSTELEIYGRPLLENAEPSPDGGDGVRFVARIARFLDPAEYQPGKRLTVRGRLAPTVTRPIGEYPYLYPVVDASVYHLWPAYRPPRVQPSYYDPYYDPWWPWGPWGHHRHWPHGW